MQSESYQQFMNACIASDATTQFAIINTQLATVAGAERAFWLRVRANERARSAMLPHDAQLVWLDLDEAVRTAPDDVDNRAQALVHSLGVCVRTERVDRFHAIQQSMRQWSRTIARMPYFWQNMALLHMRRRRWHQALCDCTKALQTVHGNSATLPDLKLCHQAHLHMYRSLAHMACGHLQQAMSDLAHAQLLAEQHNPARINHVAFALAEGELHFRQGSTQLARAALQKGLMKSASYKQRPDPWRLVETELLAARLARAEGNAVGFEHFCSRALTLCSQYDLPLSAASVAAVLAGAER
ncbi:MAG TPA: hypothetical protein VK464_06415 [Symbiobacteriaceae bacterium]|nr:hypothetical protein [Symbiobacteriaceae bacterium]